jgi:NTE family protein
MKFFNWLIKKSENSKHELPLSNHEIGIALSGGSARGFAHIGILRALEEYGIEPTIVSGTSMGSLIGVLYAAGIKPDDIQEIVKKVTFIKMVAISFRKHGLFEMNGLRHVIEEVIGKDDFSTLKKPFYLSVANLSKGGNEVKSSGPLFDFVIASCSVPVIFAPMEIDGTTYVDGGLYDNLPAGSIREKCRFLIGVNVNPVGEVLKFDSMKEIAVRSFFLGVDQNVKVSKEICDIVLEPPAILNYSFWDFDKMDEIVEVGYQYAIEMLKSGKLKVPTATKP